MLLQLQNKDIRTVVRVILDESSGCHDMDVNLPGCPSEGARILCLRYLNASTM